MVARRLSSSALQNVHPHPRRGGLAASSSDRARFQPELESRFPRRQRLRGLLNYDAAKEICRPEATPCAWRNDGCAGIRRYFGTVRSLRRCVPLLQVTSDAQLQQAERTSPRKEHALRTVGRCDRRAIQHPRSLNAARPRPERLRLGRPPHRQRPPAIKPMGHPLARREAAAGSGRASSTSTRSGAVRFPPARRSRPRPLSAGIP